MRRFSGRPATSPNGISDFTDAAFRPGKKEPSRASPKSSSGDSSAPPSAISQGGSSPLRRGRPSEIGSREKRFSTRRMRSIASPCTRSTSADVRGSAGRKTGDSKALRVTYTPSSNSARKPGRWARTKFWSGERPPVPLKMSGGSPIPEERTEPVRSGLRVALYGRHSLGEDHRRNGDRMATSTASEQDCVHSRAYYKTFASKASAIAAAT
ncbi:hypothetical protein Poly30_54350 [Planctomycetes bacterium Poly30]|uniref:Uncharacterized protein n=1 Tax=Saltatorellus ferox TaxID=2528018 RepID=A0A518F0M2_9BACT|nr:hypothetical protein Poly30_54350 [Planctomycetes bacterium Poly30]